MRPAERLAGFNQTNRDRWVAGVAQRLSPGARVLDVGAGQCRYRPLFKHCVYQAQDFGGYQGTTNGTMPEAWQYGELDYVCEATSIPVDGNTFDAVLCTEVLEHVPEPILVLKEIARILKPGGRAFITAPLGSGLHQQPYHFYGGYTPYFYERFLQQFGLDVISIESNGCFFRLLLQEINRGIGLVQARGGYPRWHPAFWLGRTLFNNGLAQWLDRLDDRIPVAEFTIGYHVEAIKREN